MHSFYLLLVVLPFLISNLIIPTTIEIRFNISLATAPIEPLKQLYASHMGELISPNFLTAFAEPSRKLIVATIIAITGRSSIIKFFAVGSVPNTKKVRGYDTAKAQIKIISHTMLFALVFSLKKNTTERKAPTKLSIPPTTAPSIK